MRRTNFNKLSSRLIRHAVEDRGMTMTAIADVLGVDKSFISRVASEQRELSGNHMHRLAEHFGMSMGAFLLSVDPPRKPRSDEERKVFGLIHSMMESCDAALEILKKRERADPAAA